MQTDNRFFDDFAKLAGGALNALTGLKTEVEGLVRQQLEGFFANLRLVTWCRCRRRSKKSCPSSTTPTATRF